MLSRRTAFRLSSQAVAALVAFAPFLASCGRPSPRGSKAEDHTGGDGGVASLEGGDDTGSDVHAEPDSLSWEAFLAALEALAEQSLQSDWDEAAYVVEVAALMGRLDLLDASFQAILDRYHDAHLGFPEINTAHDGGFFEVATLQFEPGESIDLHNHPRMTGVIVCLTGSVQIEAFNLLERRSESGELLIQKVADVHLQPGEHATLTSDHGNIHALVASEWCELLDVFTPPYTSDRIREYRWYSRSEVPVEGDDVYLAWES